MSILQRRKARQRPVITAPIREIVPVVPTYMRITRPDWPPPTQLPPLRSYTPLYTTPPVYPPPTERPRLSDVTAIIINHKTLFLVQQAYQSLTSWYDLPVVVVDNGSQDAATDAWVRSVGGMLLPDNIGHGPALHRSIQTLTTPYVLTLDSDCVVNRGGWLEQMLAYFHNPQLYAIGWLRWVDRFTGVPLEWHLDSPPPDRFILYVHPAVGLYSRDWYNRLATPFSHHGAPALANMLAAEQQHAQLLAFPVFDYVTHLVAGTRRLYGGHWDGTTPHTQHAWSADDHYPI